ncbi:alpha/beta hydrolase fold domain-containing protein [Erythrobacter sp. JK5]|uniref:alpha/beta hydrolase fold domain-containing protein n=1 Tax=Erythrobacter sp. JK5 TaxID=2829500 RepID=UPI001BA450FD|nr:alpha/beta hydrolase [Erythrobacter sp. JK5]QUL37773.1 alpha/beta hydrolase [Erythrobacter sp. JK5]
MLTDTSIELRTTRASMLLRAVVWLMSKRKPVFPKQASEAKTYLELRDPPRDAAMPESMEQRFTVEHWTAAEQQVVTIHPKSGPGEWHMLYFHGGGFVLPMFKEHWPLAAALVEKCGISITLPLYNVVPESSYADQDAVADAAFARLAAEHDPARIVLNGDSAGGHMALSLALRLARAGGPQPGKLALFAPWLDVTMQDEAMRAVEPHDTMLRIDALRELGRVWAGDRDPASPECSPLYTPPEQLAQLPPTRIWTGRHDLFIIDSRTFTARLREAGVDARLYEYAGAPHVFMAVTPTREAKDVFALLEEFLAS